MSNRSHPLGFHPARRDWLLQYQVQDSYKVKGKLAFHYKPAQTLLRVDWSR